MIEKKAGLNDSERYLYSLCKRTFLSLWSYANVFRKAGSELCDLLVVCGNDVIIFSDKFCEYPNTEDTGLNWNRWFKRAVIKSAHQLWGAENWIKRSPDRVFIDAKCEQSLPSPLIVDSDTKFHMVLVAHGASQSCHDQYGGSGSLMINTALSGFDGHTLPYAVGDLDPKRTFIHVLDDTTLDILLESRDTIADFTQYLTKREKFLRSGMVVFSPGEEELLAYYLKEINELGEHDFVVPKGENITGISVEEGSWLDFQNHPQRLAQVQADSISYMWDDLIEQFSKHAIAGTQYYVSEGGFLDSERAIRMLALENRFTRRVLANSLKEIILKTPQRQRMVRVMPMHNETFYVYLLLPYIKDFMPSYDDYRKARGNFLETTCYITRLMYPEAKHVIGIAFESGLNPHGSSEDLIYFDCSGWSDELEAQTKLDQQRLKILVAPQRIEQNNKEFPD